MTILKKAAMRVLVVGALALAPVSAIAATISGAIAINGVASSIDLSADTTNDIDVSFSSATVVGTTGDFSSIANGSAVSLTDIDFMNPTTIWSVGGFDFAASSFGNFFNNGTFAGFTASGTLSGNGFTPTLGRMTFTTQPGQAILSFSTITTVPVPAAGFLLLGGLGGLVALKRRKKA